MTLLLRSMARQLQGKTPVLALQGTSPSMLDSLLSTFYFRTPPVPTPSIALVTTLHDPEGELDPLVAPHIAGWLARFREVVVFTSPRGMGPVGERLGAHGARVVVDERPQGVDRMGRVRRDALVAAGEHPFYLLADLDRIAHWQQCFPDELARVEAVVPEQDFLVLGRTARAFESHPAVQRETERLANAAFAASYGSPMDITGGQRALSARAAALLLDQSRCETLGVDAEWPILCRRAGLRPRFLATEGLEYETADRYAAEIAGLGYDGWLDRRINTPAQWELRLRIAQQIAAAALDASARPL